MKINKILIITLINFLIVGYASGKEKEKSRSVIADIDKNIVQTTYGKVRSYKHDNSYIFKGIPYAKAERFMPPQEPDSWEGVRSSMSFGPVSPQNTGLRKDEIGFLFPQNLGLQREDCMRLNIWTNGINDNKKRPVMVWFHGGGFSAGYGHISPAFDGENINKKDVILITLNHRLNVLGFLNLSDFGDKYKYSGNVGIMDLVAALKWIHKNIDQFGGDPNNVTIFGQSGGGGKVTDLLGAPSAQGLFQKAIIQSGSRTHFLEEKYSKMIGQGFLKELGLKPSEVDSLQKIPYKTLRTAGDKVINRLNKEIGNSVGLLYSTKPGWRPCVDGDSMPYHPTDEKALALNSNIPIIIGSNKNEQEPMRENVGVPKTMEEAKELLKKKFGKKTDEYIALMKKTYPDDLQAINFLNLDTAYRSRALGLAGYRAKTNPVYMYFIKWNSPSFNGKYQSPHGIELPFVFSNVEKMPELTGGDEDAFALNDKIGQAWINFARIGDPNNEYLPSWPVYSVENGLTMSFDNKCEVRSHHDEELLEFIAKFNMKNRD